MFNASGVRKRAMVSLQKAQAEYDSARKLHIEVTAVVMALNRNSDEPMPDAADE
jgi:hypothetical protein